MEACESKRYSDACVQTSPNPSATRDQGSSNAPTSHPIKRVTYVDQASSVPHCDGSSTRRVCPRTPLNQTKTYIPLNRPSRLLSRFVGTEEQRRVFSLPDQDAADLPSRKLANSVIACPRTVSMHAAIQHFPQGGLTYEKSLSTDISPSTSYEEDYSHHQRYSQMNDLPHTPALEFTPDTIEISDDSFSCSAAYSHARASQVNSSKAVHKDWHAWSSPPRPIPALHGPSSLPYARCPSGAEGTIIEEPSSAPCLIWGLKDCASTHPERDTMARGNQGMLVSSPVTQEHRKTDTRDRDAGAVRPSQERTMVDSRQNLHGAGHDQYSLQHETSARNCDTKHECLPIGESDPNFDHATNEHSTSQIIINQDLHDRTDGTIVRQQLPQLSASIPYAVLINHERNGHPMYQDESAPAITCVDRRKTFKQPSATDACGMKIRRSNNFDVGEYCVDTRKLRKNHADPVDLPLTSPETASFTWSSRNSPLLMDGAFALQQQSHMGTSRPFASQVNGLNLHAPAGSIESLSEQLKRLILRQQMNHDTATASLGYNYGTAHHSIRNQVSAPPLRPRSSTIPVSRKPEMPINLHDLVVRHNQDYSFISGGTVSASAAPTTTPELDSATARQKLNLVPANVDNTAAHEDVLSERRNPRSVPLARLLEKKLAPVPEETSFGADISASLAYPAIAPLSTSPGKDYNFAETRSSLEASLPSEAHNIPDEVSEQAQQRNVLAPLRQMKRQLKRKTPADTKASPSKPAGHKSSQNDENVHNPSPTTTTLRRKAKSINKRGVSDPQKLGRKKN